MKIPAGVKGERCLILKIKCIFVASLVTLSLRTGNQEPTHTKIHFEMKTVFKKTVLLGTVVLAGMGATIHDFSAPPSPQTSQRFHPVTNSQQRYVFNTQVSGGDVSLRIPRRFVVINTRLAALQEGILGDSMAEDLKVASREYLALQ
ncbi:hypothetical protein [Salmonirosea aquatica]|uniref:Uncharacterized protein n=1 Tax=Salmonirosea aquatica TaxID=2654236 RepID=A0A7C9FYD6_9BACT|nr:hypothetical protein [Cytophagaceae bacterium SJW1-29]